MTIRIIDDFFTHGHPDFRRPPKGFYPRSHRPDEPSFTEPHADATRDAVTREWLAHVEAGRIG